VHVITYKHFWKTLQYWTSLDHMQAPHQNVGSVLSQGPFPTISLRSHWSCFSQWPWSTSAP